VIKKDGEKGASKLLRILWRGFRDSEQTKNTRESLTDFEDFL